MHWWDRIIEGKVEKEDFEKSGACETRENKEDLKG